MPNLINIGYLCLVGSLDLYFILLSNLNFPFSNLLFLVIEIGQKNITMKLVIVHNQINQVFTHDTTWISMNIDTFSWVDIALTY